MEKKQNIVQIITENLGNFSRQQLKIATYLVDNYKLAGFMTATRLAEAAGVSQPTVIRFAQSLGFPQYQLFVEAFLELLKEDLTSTDRLTLSLEHSDDTSSSSQEILSREIETLGQLSLRFPHREFDKLVAAICKASRVYILGSRGGAALAQHFSYFLGKVKSRVTAVTNGASESYDLMLGADKDALAIPLAFPRYPRETMELASFCKAQGMTVMGITDRADSPLGQWADNLLVIPVTFGTLFDSYCSVFCLFSALVTSVGKDNQQESKQLSQTFEDLVRQRNLFTDGTDIPDNGGKNGR